jgi:hypothetical protein
MPTPNLRSTRFCEGCTPDGSLELIPLRQWLVENFRTRDQIARLLQRRLIVAKKFKGRYYVAWNPAVPEEFRDY